MSQHTNPFSFSGPITLDNLGDLFSHHRSLTGGWSMEASGGEGAEGGEGGDQQTFEAITSQEELDRRIGPRLAREREKYGDYDQIKQELATLKESTQTEAEKALETARTEARSEERQRSDRLLVLAKAEVLAAQARFKAPEAVVASLNLTDIKVDDAGAVDTAALKTKIDDAVKSGAFVIDGATGPRPDGSQGGSGTATSGGVDKGREMFEARRKKTT